MLTLLFNQPIPAGTLAATEAKDTAAIAGAVVAIGSLVVIETQDTAALSGSFITLITGTLASTEAKDVAAISGTAGASGSLTATEAQDAASLTNLSGPLSATESKDVAAIAVDDFVNWNPFDKSSDIVLSGGNLGAARLSLSSTWESVRATIAHSTGSWVFSVTLTDPGDGVFVGAGTSSASLSNFVGNDASGYGYAPSGGIIITNNSASASVATAGQGDVIAVGYDGSTLRWFKNGVSIGTIAASGALFPMISLRSTTINPIVAGNFGPLSPSGYSLQPWGGVVFPILAAQEPQDTAGIGGASGTLAATEAKDVAAVGASYLAPVTGTLGATEAKDVAAFVSNDSEGSLAATEAKDTAAITVAYLAPVIGTLAATEAKDSAALSGSYNVAGSLAATEGQDVAQFSAVLIPSGDLVATENQDTGAIILRFREPRRAAVPFSKYDYGWVNGRPVSGGLRRRRGY